MHRSGGGRNGTYSSISRAWFYLYAVRNLPWQGEMLRERWVDERVIAQAILAFWLFGQANAANHVGTTAWRLISQGRQPAESVGRWRIRDELEAAVGVDA